MTGSAAGDHGSRKSVGIASLRITGVRKVGPHGLCQAAPKLFPL
jgi:hypothetical protein